MGVDAGQPAGSRQEVSKLEVDFGSFRGMGID